METQGEAGFGPLLKIRKLNADTRPYSVHVQEHCLVGDLKKAAADELGIPWWQQQWLSAKGCESPLANDRVLDVSQIPEVTCLVVLDACFPLDTGKFNHLFVTGVCGDPVFAWPGSGRLEIAGIGPEEEEIDDAAVLQERLLTIKGDGQCEQGAPHTSAAWSKEFQLDKDNVPILVGWRVHYVANGWPGPRFGLTTMRHLTTNVGTNRVTPVLSYSFSGAYQEHTSQVICSPTSFTVGSMVRKINGSWITGGEGKIIQVTDGKCVIDGPRAQVRDVDVSSLAADETCFACKSSPSPGDASDKSKGMSTKKDGSFEYDVLVLFDSVKKEVRAGVAWGGVGLRMDTAAVPSELWPSSELRLVPYVSVNHEDFNEIDGIAARNELHQLPITIEALTRKQMPEEVVHALLQG